MESDTVKLHGKIEDDQSYLEDKKQLEEELKFSRTKYAEMEQKVRNCLPCTYIYVTVSAKTLHVSVIYIDSHK